MKFAMVFPGQGSQSVGMLAGYGDAPLIRGTLAEASDVLKQDVGKLISEGPAEELNSTVNTQPVMVIAGICAWRLWRDLGGAEPSLLAGHSLGEYTALVAAGAISFSDCLPLVRLRAQAMQEAVPEGTGGIAAIVGLDAAKVAEVCRDAAEGEVLEPANLNSPVQVVIAGHRAAVERGMALAKQRGAKIATMLPMSAPSHCSLMKPAAARLRERLEVIDMKKPTIPVIQNRNVDASADPARIREALVEQLDHPVRWVETVQFLGHKGVKRIVECGPGKVLVGLSKRIVPDIEYIALTDSAAVAAAAAQP
jgi:[acyl-carrier-protein] S-malonyltransferase